MKTVSSLRMVSRNVKALAEAALQELEQRRGLHYDARVVDACLRLFRENNFRLEAMAPQW